MISTRLRSLDVLRGITIAGMILVNDPGSWHYIYAPLAHASWHGLTPTDLVFPFFMFIMGISTYISLQKYQFKFNRETVLKILIRSAVIFLIGLGIRWLATFFSIYHQLSLEGIKMSERLLPAIWNIENLRILGVLQRLAICYAAVALIALLIQHRHIPYLIGIILFGYFVLLITGNGFEQSEQNIISVIDQAILGINHMYKDKGLAIDPEGLLSTLPSIAHVLIGFYCGKVLLNTSENHTRVLQLFIIGTTLTLIGFLLSYGCPINKKIWSPTFVLVSCGLASSCLALLMWIIDIQGYQRWGRALETFGINPLFSYVLASLLSVLLSAFHITYQGSLTSLQQYFYLGIFQPIFGEYFGSLMYAIAFVAVVWMICDILYRKKIYIKI